MIIIKATLPPPHPYNLSKGILTYAEKTVDLEKAVGGSVALICCCNSYMDLFLTSAGKA